MDKYESLSHAKWEFKDHFVLIPDPDARCLTAPCGGNLGRAFRKLTERKESRVEGKSDAKPCAHDDFGSAHVTGGTGDRVHQGQERDPSGAGVRGAEAEFRRATLPGAVVLCIHSGGETKE